MPGMELLWMGWSSIVTLAVMSLLWKENPSFKFVEHVSIGAGAAHLFMYGVLALKTTAIDPIQTGKILLILPLVVGVLQLGRVTPWKWISRYPIAILVGTGIGIMLATTIQGQIIAQLRDIGESIVRSKDTLELVSCILAGVGTLMGFTYFIFTREHKGILGRTARIGRIVLMAGFGVGWGCEVGWFLTAIAAQLEIVLNFIRTLFGIPY